MLLNMSDLCKQNDVCRKEYEQHSEEDDPERVQQIIDRAVRDAEWILKKYNK